MIFTGVQASGKSTFYRERFFDTHVRINMDMLKTRHRERILLDACLAAKQPFVVDNTNVLAKERTTYISASRAAGFRVLGYLFRTELRAAIARNKQRTGKQVIPIPGLIGTWKKLQPPVLEEGYDELFSVDISDTREFVVTPYIALP